MQDTREMLLQESPIKLMFKLCAPAIIGMVVIGLYSFMDGVFAGQLIGENAMGAISIAYPITLFNSGISTLIGIGSASVLSRAIGNKDQEIIDKIMGNLIALVLLLSTIIMVIGLIFTRQLLAVSGAHGEILELGVRYLRIVFIGSIFVNFAQSANMVMRGEGLMKKAMSIMAFGAVLNIVLDPILIKAFGDKEIVCNN
ncbi:multidrug export protein MepA [Clostridium acetireducens DSM 10703]|jgi:Na+-driven multidrug efflux pump|uniref:Multidrug export protein MepA n=1 Tax=Clostridium acetireducens DSM 10703 TaxID=1121290 RepID=A0A1E8F2A7_9CLOT|nr:multidrug export protein MepA [Clostridium acetireducens DSM 10703]